MYQEFIIMYVLCAVIIVLLAVVIVLQCMALKKSPRTGVRPQGSVYNQYSTQNQYSPQNAYSGGRTAICRNCATQFDAAHAICPKCGTPR